MVNEPVVAVASIGAGFCAVLMARSLASDIRAWRQERHAKRYPYTIISTPVHDPDTGELLGWVDTRSDTGEFLELWGQKKNLNSEGDS